MFFVLALFAKPLAAADFPNAKLGQQGFSHKPAQLEDGVWRVEFKKKE